MIKLLILTLIIFLIPGKASSCSIEDIEVSSFMRIMKPVATSIRSVSGDGLNIVNDLLAIEDNGIQLDYDKLIFVTKSGKTKVMVMTVKNECVNNGTTISSEDYLKILSELEGI